MNLKSMSNLQQRLIVSTFSTLVMFLAIYFSFDTFFRPAFVLLIASIIGTALWEFYAIPKAMNYNPLKRTGILGTFIYVIVTFIAAQYPTYSQLPPFILLTILISVFGYFFIKGEKPFVNISITLFGIAYLTIPLSYLIKINYLFPVGASQDGRLWLIYLLIVTKMTDIGAYVFGKTFGKRKITPFISPAKTLEGSLGGFLGALLTSILLGYGSHLFTSPLSLSFYQMIALGAILGIVAQFGDLTESLLKRDGQIKDSNQLPGLGGVLDIVDSMVFTAPLLYFFLKTQELPF